MTTVSRDELTAALLLAGQHRIDPATGPGTRWPPSDAVTAAATALAAGEPGRARRSLDDAGGAGDPGRPVLKRAIATFDRQFTPGGLGSVLTGEAVAQLAAADRALPESARATPLGVLATVLLPEVFAARAMTEDEHRAGLTAFVGRARHRLERQWAGLGPAVRSFLALARADLANREGDRPAAAAAFAQAQVQADGDAAAQAHLELVRGDWLAEPLRHVESMGLAAGPHAPAAMRDPGAAAECYARAEGLWAAIGSRAGRAAVLLRQAHLARLDGHRDERDERIAYAHRLAAESGHGALAALITVHGLIDTVADGHRVPPESIDQVREWMHTDGSLSYGHGLARLLLMRARAWRDDGDFSRAHGTLRLARRLGGTDGPRYDGASISVDLAALYGGIGYRRARMVLADLELASALEELSGRTPEALDWMVLAVRARELFAEANALADPEAVDLAADRLQQLLHIPVRPEPDDLTAVATACSHLATSWGQSTALSGWYAGLRLRDRGQEAAAQLFLRQALAAAGDDGLLRCAILAAVPDRDEALLTALPLAGALPSLQAAALFLRLDQAELAELALDAADEEGPPWTISALRARLHGLLGKPEEQVRYAEEAVTRFEQRQRALGRDMLRSSATDDPVVARAYHDLITGHLACDAPLDALAVSDRGRGLPGVLLDDLAALSPEARQAGQAWLAAGSRWAAAYEAAALPRDVAGPLEPPVVRAVLDAAEAALDEAEDRVRRVAPDLLRSRPVPPADLRAAARRLPEDAVLLAYHHSDSEYAGWALTPDGTAVSTGVVAGADVVGHAARWHAALSGGGTDPVAAAALAGRLLAPFAEQLAGRRRVWVVPHRDLSFVPVHALPWEGDLLGARHDVSYLPAVALLGRPARRATPEGGALIVGDPAFDPGRRLRRLPGTRVEALAVADLLGVPDPLIGTDATLDHVRKMTPGCGIVHLGSHAIVPGGAPNLGQIPLAGGDRLTVADLLSLDLSGALVVLSACQTGAGTATLGGDVVGLTRAALIAGAAHVVVSLWPVHDAVGALVMHAFYRHLAGGAVVSAALAQAQRDIRACRAEELDTAYAQLADRYGVPVGEAGRRDADPDDDTVPDPMHAWAPFIHVGGFS